MKTDNVIDRCVEIGYLELGSTDDTSYHARRESKNENVDYFTTPNVIPNTMEIFV